MSRLLAIAAPHLLVSLAVVVPWALLAPRVERAGHPPVLALLLVVALVLPTACGVLVRRRLHAEGVTGWPAARARLGLQHPTVRTAVRCGLPALLVALLLPGLALPLERLGHETLRWPSWTSTTLPLAGSSPGEAAALVLAWTAVAVVLGPLTEEVLFRGLVQPLLPGAPWARIVAGSTLFAVYHLWQPATWPTVLLVTLPVAWLRERTGSTWLCVGVHATANAVAASLLVVGVLAR